MSTSVKIRGLEEEEINKLDRLAKSKSISREEYLRRLIKTHLIIPEIKSVQEKYENLVEVMMEILEVNSELLEDTRKILESNSELLEDTRKILENKND